MNRLLEILKDMKKVLIIGFIIILIGVSLVIIMDKAKDNACKELGYEEFRQKTDFTFCVDLEDNLHYITWNYETFPYKVKAKEISVGAVRVIKQ